MNNDLISRKELRKAFKKSPVFTKAILYYARQLIDDAPAVELDEDDIQSLLNKRCMTVVTNEYLRSLYDSLTPCYQTTSCLDCKMYDKKNHRCPRFCEVIRDLVKEAESIKPEECQREMTDNQDMNREEYLRRYVANFIKVYGVGQWFKSWVIVDGIKYDFEINKIRIDDGDNGFIQ